MGQGSCEDETLAPVKCRVSSSRGAAAGCLRRAVYVLLTAFEASGTSVTSPVWMLWPAVLLTKWPTFFLRETRARSVRKASDRSMGICRGERKGEARKLCKSANRVQSERERRKVNSGGRNQGELQ